jgi:cell division protein FtsA
MAKTKKLLGLDIGATKIACVIAELDNNGRLSYLGQGISPPEGFRNGIVINLERATESVATAIEDAEKTADRRAKSCSIYVGISGNYIKHITSVGTVPVKNPSKGISQKDVNEVIRQAQTIRLPNDEQIIHLIPNQFMVDGQKGIHNPIGMFGFRLEVEALLVIGAVSAIENIYRVLDNLELKAESLVLQPQAVACAVAEPEDKDLGVAIVDIGGQTNISIFKEGVLRYYKTLSLGGENITKDISIGLRTPYKKAEEIKKSYGAAMINYITTDEPIVIEDMSGRINKQISQRLLTSIIEPRLQEILEHVDTAIRETGCVDTLSGGIILTGGTSLLKGIDLLAEQIFRMPVKIGNLKISTESQTEQSNVAKSAVDSVWDATYTTAIGLIRYSQNVDDLHVPAKSSVFGEITEKIKELLA